MVIAKLFTRERFVDAAWGGVLFLIIQYLIRLPRLLLENAMMGGIDDWIAVTLGLTWAKAFSFLSEYGISLAAAALVLWACHLVWHRRWERTAQKGKFFQHAIGNVTGPNPRLRRKKLFFAAISLAICLAGSAASSVWLYREIWPTVKEAKSSQPEKLQAKPIKRMIAYELGQRQRALDEIDKFIDDQRLGRNLPIDQFRWQDSYERGGIDRIKTDMESFAGRLQGVNRGIEELKQRQRYSDISDLLIPLDLGSQFRPQQGLMNDLGNSRGIINNAVGKSADAQPYILRGLDFWQKYSSVLNTWAATTRKTIAEKRSEYGKIDPVPDEKN